MSYEDLTLEHTTLKDNNGPVTSWWRSWCLQCPPWWGWGTFPHECRPGKLIPEPTYNIVKSVQIILNKNSCMRPLLVGSPLSNDDQSRKGFLQRLPWWPAVRCTHQARKPSMIDSVQYRYDYIYTTLYCNIYESKNALQTVNMHEQERRDRDKDVD